MAENPTPEADKTRRSRSFGSFLMVLLVLIVVLMVAGNDRLTSTSHLSQDEYEWHLHHGWVLEQRFKGTEQGTNLIEGLYNKYGSGKTQNFDVRYASLEGREERFRDLKGVLEYEVISAADFDQALKDGLFEPVAARYLTGYTRPTPVAGANSGDAPTEASGDQGEAASESSRSARDDSGDDTGPALVNSLPINKQESLLVTANIDAEKIRGREKVGRFRLPRADGSVNLRIEFGGKGAPLSVVRQLEAADIPVQRLSFDLTQERGTRWVDSTNMLSWFMLYLLPWLIIFAVFMFFMRQMRSQGGAGGVMNFGRSRAQLYSKESHTNVTFDDVAGAVEAKSEVREIVEFLKNPSRFTRIGGRIPRGVLLVGPPGCGKTLLAKAIAGEAEVPFFSISGSDFVEMFVGVGASRVRDLFKQARENSPCIIFLDEIDAVGRRRGSGMGGGHDEREQTLNAILVEMDGFGTDEGIIVVAATNRPDVLDPALLRPGRFDREVTIELPDYEGREAILKVHLKRIAVSDDVDVTVLARSTPGYSGADLAAIINEAAIMAVLAKRDQVIMEDLEEARDKVRYGRQKLSRKVEEDDRKITAYHEAGHAVVSALLEEVDAPHKVTIVPRGRALGATMILPERESYHMQRRKLLGQLVMLFGGRAAEELFCGDISAGASDDIRRATDLARAMVAELGMSAKVGPVNYAERQGSDFLGTELMRGKLHSEETARTIDEEVKRILDEAYGRSEDLLSRNREGVESLAQALLRYETINGPEIDQLLGGTTLDDLRPDPPPADPEAIPAEERSEAVPRPERAHGAGRSDELPGEPGLSPA